MTLEGTHSRTIVAFPRRPRPHARRRDRLQRVRRERLPTGIAAVYIRLADRDLFALDIKLTSWPERVARRMLLERAGTQPLVILQDRDLPPQPALV